MLLAGGATNICGALAGTQMSASLQAAALQASARALLMLRHHDATKTQQLSIVNYTTSGTSSGMQSPAHAAVQGILKCLPYEMPHLQAAAYTVSSAYRGARAGAMSASSQPLDGMQADVYGVHVDANVVHEPHMQYDSQATGESPEDLPQRQFIGACIITGAVCYVLNFELLICDDLM